MAKIHFLQPEDFQRQNLKTKKHKNYRKLCLALASGLILENLLLLYMVYHNH